MFQILQGNVPNFPCIVCQIALNADSLQLTSPGPRHHCPGGERSCVLTERRGEGREMFAFVNGEGVENQGIAAVLKKFFKKKEKKLFGVVNFRRKIANFTLQKSGLFGRRAGWLIKHALLIPKVL